MHEFFFYKSAKFVFVFVLQCTQIEHVQNLNKSLIIIYTHRKSQKVTLNLELRHIF